MDTATLIGIGIAGALGAYLATRSQKKQNQALAPIIEGTLRAQGPLTVPKLTEAVGLKGFSARGKVILALNDLVAQGKVRANPAPEGTPQLRKVNFITYELTSSA